MRRATSSTPVLGTTPSSTGRRRALTTTPLNPPNCVPGIVRGGSGNTPGARTDSGATGNAGTSIIEDNAIVADDTGREVAGTNIPPSSFVGAVTDTGPQFPTTNTGSATVGSFQLVDQGGSPVDPTGPVSGITLSAEGAPGFLTAGETPDPLYDATDPTPGGGDTGSVLISPFIRPGTVSNVYYNHYSWLRDDGGPLRRGLRQRLDSALARSGHGLGRSRRPRPPRLRRPAGPPPVRAGRLHQPSPFHHHHAHGHGHPVPRLASDARAFGRRG